MLRNPKTCSGLMIVFLLSIQLSEIFSLHLDEFPLLAYISSFSKFNPLFLFAPTHEPSWYSEKRDEYYFTDHSFISKGVGQVAEKKQREIDLEFINELDDVKILAIDVQFEYSYYLFQHTYTIIKTELSLLEKQILGANYLYKYYITEKNSLGIVWNVVYESME